MLKGKTAARMSRQLPTVAVMCFTLVGLLASLIFASEDLVRHTTTPSFSVTGGESRPVLDPDLFTGRTREAYQAAKEIPNILDKLFCYCFCHHPPQNHKSLLSCFADNHASFCPICEDEAIRAHELHKKGHSLSRIRRQIDREFGKYK